MEPSLRAEAEAWLAEDPDPETRAELSALLGAGDEAAVRERFNGRLEFGTAGLRGALGAGPNRMNRALVRRAAAGLARWLLAERGDPARAAGVAIGYDARHKSDVFALDTALVMAGAGIAAHLLPRPLPTPVLAFTTARLGCAAGVMVTASHNPRGDNGYKVYLGDGAQIAPPVDTAISAAIGSVGSLGDVPLADPDDPHIHHLDDEVVDAYLAAVEAAAVPGPSTARLVYTPMHGVGGAVVCRLFERSGFPPLHVVVRQFDPDPAFPTVPFPNPEEPGALDLALSEARSHRADAVLANDPDADRLAAAVPDGTGGFRALTGDELGWVLADFLLERSTGGARLVITTVVSSGLLRKMAADHGVHYQETLTGFKWIARAAMARPGLRFVFGYEEALGYCVGDTVRDKDGISAALAFARLLSSGPPVPQRLEALARRHGRHVTRQRSLRVEGADALAELRATMDRLRANPPEAIGGSAVTAYEDLRLGGRLPPADVLRFELGDDARVIVRPSGTEPKLKLYVEVVVPPEHDGGAETHHLEAAMVQLVDDHRPMR